MGTTIADSVRYEYDRATGALSRVHELLGGTFAYMLNARSELIRTALPGAIIDSVAYDLAGRRVGHWIYNRTPTSLPLRNPEPVLRRDTLTYDARDKVLQSLGRQGFVDTTTVLYSGLGHVVQHDYRMPAIPNFGRPERIIAREQMWLDALGNLSSGRDSTNARSPNYSVTSVTPHSRSYVPSSGRLDLRSVAGEMTIRWEYDDAGNTVFSSPNSNYDPRAFPTLEDHAFFYASDGKLRVSEYRRAEANTGAQLFWWWDAVFEEYRYDALGRRILVRSRRNCRVDSPFEPCRRGVMRRTVWDGEAELYEIQVPGGDDISAAQLENDTLRSQRTPGSVNNGGTMYWDSNPLWGRVAYVHAAGIDQPVAITRINYEDWPWDRPYREWPEPFTVVPHWNWRGQAEYGAYASGAAKKCYPGDSGRCVQINWPVRAFAFSPPSNDTLASWVGTIVEGKPDGTTTQYSRNRYFDPSTGQFTQEDPIGLAGGLNLYGFGGADPVNFADPFGLKVCFRGSPTQIQRSKEATEKATGSTITLDHDNCISKIEANSSDANHIRLRTRLEELASPIDVIFIVNWYRATSPFVATESWYDGWSRTLQIGDGWEGSRWNRYNAQFLGICLPLLGKHSLGALISHELLGHGYGQYKRGSKSPTGERYAIEVENSYHSAQGERERCAY